ncbi:transposase [Rhizobium sp. UGM030330-04]|uniref:transposase n=1 Tax=Rhizobium sp. UGM030330-04 TaxID=1378077 RepID=UPI000DA1BF2D|nr:transposase [Rhizobium sp. UGM030330-04]
MGKSNFSEEFKRDAVRQITERGYPVAEVSQRLGGEAALFVQVEKEVFRLERQGQRRSRRDQTAEEGIGSRYRGARHPKKRSRALVRLCAVETGGVTIAAGGELPKAYWRRSTPLKNVAHGLLRT